MSPDDSATFVTISVTWGSHDNAVSFAGVTNLETYEVLGKKKQTVGGDLEGRVRATVSFSLHSPSPFSTPRLSSPPVRGREQMGQARKL